MEISRTEAHHSLNLIDILVTKATLEVQIIELLPEVEKHRLELVVC